MSRIEFTEEQNLILDSNAKNIIISACAGAGKSSTLLEKANRETKNCLAWKKIAILTFTNKSKNDLINRVENETITISTFHGFIFENIFPFDLMIGCDLYESFHKRADTYFDWLDILYNKKAILGSTGAKDFTLEHAIKLCKKKNVLSFIKSKFHAIYIDEAQDNNIQQYELIEIFISCGIKVLMVGDPDQTLYSFRGASVDKFMAYSQDKRFEKYELSKNFRCHSIINEVANGYHFPEFSKHEKGCGYILIKENKLDDVVDRLKNESIVFLKRTNNSLYDYDGKFEILKEISFSKELDEIVKSIVIGILKCKFEDNYNIYLFLENLKIDIENFNSDEIEILRSSINFLIGLETNVSKLFWELLGVLEFKTKILETYLDLVSHKDTKKFFQNKSKHKTMTIHSSKGLEFDNVIIKREDFYYKGNFERNNFYVAITRARKRVMVIL